jgi:predicted anti-sigma-YlaC factor YlaD
MRCQEIESELDAYLAKELVGEIVTVIEKHLEGCLDCRAELQLLAKEKALYADYAASIDASLKAGNRESSSTGRFGKSSGHWWRWAAAAAVLAAAFLSWRIYTDRNHHGPESVQVSESAAAVPVAQAALSYEQALSLLHKQYAGKRANLDPKLASDVDRNLEITKSAVEECQQALRENPGNAHLAALLLHDYEMQLGLLKQITEAL